MTSGIGIYQPRTQSEVAPLARVARAYGADFLFYIGGSLHDVRFGVPTKFWPDEESFLQSLGVQGWKLVGLETEEKAATPLDYFYHPEHALYLLGPDNGTLPWSLLRMCDHTVSVESPGDNALPIGVVGGIVLHDRYVSAT